MNTQFNQDKFLKHYNILTKKLKEILAQKAYDISDASSNSPIRFKKESINGFIDPNFIRFCSPTHNVSMYTNQATISHILTALNFVEKGK